MYNQPNSLTRKLKRKRMGRLTPIRTGGERSFSPSAQLCGSLAARRGASWTRWTGTAELAQHALVAALPGPLRDPRRHPVPVLLSGLASHHGIKIFSQYQLISELIKYKSQCQEKLHYKLSSLEKEAVLQISNFWTVRVLTQPRIIKFHRERTIQATPCMHRGRWVINSDFCWLAFQKPSSNLHVSLESVIVNLVLITCVNYMC